MSRVPLAAVLVLLLATGCGLSRAWRRAADPDPVKRQRAILALGRAVEEGRMDDADRARFAAKVRDAASDPVAICRSAALLGAARGLPPEEVLVLARAALADEIEIVRRDAVGVLAGMAGHEEVTGLLIERLRSDVGERVRYDAARALATRPAAGEALVDALETDTPAVAAAALASLRVLAGEDHGDNVYRWRVWARKAARSAGTP